MSNKRHNVTFGSMFAFFIPLSASASLMMLSHLIINSTLARAYNPEIAIAGFAIALTLWGLADRPLNLLRQTCSVLLSDQRSFVAIKKVSFAVMTGILLFSLLLGFTPVGPFMMKHVFDLGEEMLQPTLLAYRVILFACIFSGIRSIYQGVIISNFKTKWLTIGMIVRLIVMYLLSLWFIRSGPVDGAWVGSLIFIVGMMIEALVCYWEGRGLLKKIPAVLHDRKPVTPSTVFGFYRPILYSSVLALLIGPSVNALLGRTVDYSLALASYALATNLLFVVNSVLFYTHQIVLNFYKTDRKKSLHFVMLISLVPAALMALLGYTPLGALFMTEVMGVNERLMLETIHILRVIVIATLIFPWLDYCNGLAMLWGRTKIMVWSQGMNLLITLLVLFACIALIPGWNGVIGAIAISAGMLGEIIVVRVGLNMSLKRVPEGEV